MHLDIPRRRTEEIDELVASIILDAERPIGAYAIVSETERLGSPMAPTQIYRSIDRLLASRAIERIATLRAFVPGSSCEHFHMICNKCGTVTSVSANEIGAVLTELSKSMQFCLATVHLEITGRCKVCTQSNNDGVDK